MIKISKKSKKFTPLVMKFPKIFPFFQRKTLGDIAEMEFVDVVDKPATPPPKKAPKKKAKKRLTSTAESEKKKSVAEKAEKAPPQAPVRPVPAGDKALRWGVIHSQHKTDVPAELIK